MEELYRVIASIIENRRDESRINAAWVANEALQQADPTRTSPPGVYGFAIEHAKQHARGLLRKSFDPSEPENPQHELFTVLQWRYPAARDKSDPADQPSYVLREYMSKDDVRFNVMHFRMASEALAKHADALQSWWDGRRVVGSK